MISQDKKARCVILGGGGHSKGLIDALHALGDPVELVGILDPDASKWGYDLLGVKIQGPDELLQGLFQKGVTHFIVGLGGVGDNKPRMKLFEFGVGIGMQPLSVVHPAAIISPFSSLGLGVQIFPQVVVMPGATIGDNAILNSCALVEHDCIIEAHAHVSSGAHLAGNVSVGCGSHIGIGSVVRQGIKIGNFAVIGAGAVVVKDVPSKQTVVGNPASILKKDNAIENTIN